MSKRKIRGKLGNVVQIHVLPFGVNVNLHLSSICVR